MTSKKVLFPALLPQRIVGYLVGCLLISISGCQPDPPADQPIVEPFTLQSPYRQTRRWAVAPLLAKGDIAASAHWSMTERLIEQLHQIDGLEVVPLSEAQQAIAAQQITSIEALDAISQLMHQLQVDGLIVGHLTAWSAYHPPVIGGSLRLYGHPDSLGGIDPENFRASGRLPQSERQGTVTYGQPLASTTFHHSAANGTILTHLKQYAHGRAPSDTPAGWRRYLLDMDLYSEFVSYDLIRRLLDAEWRRLHQTSSSVDQSSFTRPPVP